MILRFFGLIILLTVAMPAQAQDIDAPFDRLVDKAWAVVITGSDLDPLYVEQINLLALNAEEIRAREIVTIHFEDRSLDLLPALSVFAYQLPILKENRDTNLLEELLMTDDDIFSVVLVGKDGLTKYVWTAPVTAAVLFNMMDHPVPMESAGPKPPARK